jgi:hypothetical protein
MLASRPIDPLLHPKKKIPNPDVHKILQPKWRRKRSRSCSKKWRRDVVMQPESLAARDFLGDSICWRFSCGP